MFSFIANIFKDPKATDQDINLLLLGETGVGKSTLINSISNYFNYPDFKKAQKEKIDVLIPVCLNLSNGSKVYGNPDENENHESGKSATQQVKVYLFPIKMGRKSFNLRLVDTPGVGDPRGIDQDNTNLDNILSYLATLKKLHGICFVLKSNQTRFTKFVEYCLKQILTRLDKSASENIIFITTYSKSAQYTAGETKAHCLEPLVRDIKSKPPHVSIPLSDKNIFAVDNEAFKALLEIQEGKQFSKHELKGLGKSWQISSEAIRRLLKYIIGDFRNAALKPHEVENTISVNEVRFLIEQLATPIAEVSELIQDNLRLLDRHKKSLNLENQTVEQLKEQLHIPCVDLSVKELSQPVTVCTDAECTDIVKVNDVTQWHYRQRCHNPCYLSGIPKEMIEDPGIVNCAAMSGQEKCQRCGCHWKVHMHIYKETEKIEVQKDDQNVKDAIKTKEDARVHIENLMKDLNKRMKELEDESKTISKIIAKFSYFLQEHALTPFNDAYSDYIKQLIKNERHLGKYSDQEVIAKLEKLLSQHEHLQKTFQESAKKFQAGSGGSDLTPQGIKNSITELYNLKHMGKTIQELIKTSSACRHKETQKNFSCIVSQQIDLIEKVVEEEQYQKVDYSEYDDTDAIYDGTEFYGSEYSYQTIMQRRQNKTPASEYALDGPTDDYHSIYEPEYGVTYEPRTNDSDEYRSMRSSSSRQYSRQRFYDDDVSIRSTPRNRQRSKNQRRYSEDLYGKKDIPSSRSRPSRHNYTPDSSHQSRSSADRLSRENMYEESSTRNNRHRNEYELSRTSSRSSYDWNNSKYSRDSDNRNPVKLHRSESRAKYETRSQHTREPKHEKERVSDDRRHHHHHHDDKDNRSVRSSRTVPKNDSSRRSRGSEEYHDRESGRKSRSKRHDELEDSSRNHRHRRDSYDSDDHHPRRSFRSDHVSKGKSSKYEKKSEIHRYDSDSDRSNSSFDSAHTGRDNYRRKQRDSERGNDSGDSDNKHSVRSSRNAHGTKHVDSKNRRKSKPNDKKYESDDQHSTRSSRREQPQSESRKKHNKSDDSDDKHSSRSSRSGYSVRNNKSKNQKVSKSSLTKKSESTKKNYASDDNTSDKSEKSSKRHSNASSYSSETRTLNKKSEDSQSDEDVENEE